MLHMKAAYHKKNVQETSKEIYVQMVNLINFSALGKELLGSLKFISEKLI